MSISFSLNSNKNVLVKTRLIFEVLSDVEYMNDLSINLIKNSFEEL